MNFALQREISHNKHGQVPLCPRPNRINQPDLVLARIFGVPEMLSTLNRLKKAQIAQRNTQLARVSLLKELLGRPSPIKLK